MLKRLTILIALVLLLLPVVGVQAGSMDGAVYCGDLGDSDCQILIDNAAVMDEVFSASFNLTMDVTASGDAAEDNMRLSGSGGGSLALDPAVAAELMSAEAAADAGNLGALIELALTAMTGDITLSVNGASADEPFDMTLNLLLKDGVIVFNAGVMEELSGESMEGFEWFGVDVSGALDDVLAEVGMGTSPDADHDMMTDDSLDNAATVTRLADDTAAGVPVAVFETQIDLSALGPMFAAEADVAAMSMAGAITSRQYIGLADHFTHRMEVAGEMTLPKLEQDAAIGHVDLTINIAIDMSAFNQPVSVEIPEDAVVFPLAMMMQMGSQ